MQINFKSRLFWALSVVLVMTAVVWSLLPQVSSHAAASTSQDRRPAYENFDFRYDKSEQRETVINRLRARGNREKKAALKEKRGETMRAAEKKLARKVPNVRVKRNDELGSPLIVDVAGRGKGFLTSAASSKAQNRESVVRSFIRANRELYGLGEDDLLQYSLRADYSNPNGELSFVSLERKVNGIPFFRGELAAAFTKNGELFRTVGEIAPEIQVGELDKQPRIGADQAVAMAAALIGREIDPASLKLIESGEDRYLFERGEFSYDVPVELNYFPIEPGSATLAWNVMLVESNAGYTILIDANDGTLYFRKNLVNDQTESATYAFYNAQSPAPLSPTTSFPGATVQGATIDRTIISLISEHQFGNTDPWLPDGATTTTGNNVDAGMDTAAPDGIDPAGRPVALDRNFVYSYNPGPGNPPPGEAPTLPDYQNGESVNMFVWTNRYHDRLYALGFTEAARNFQQNNYGRGGLGNDRVLAQGQDFSGTDNANFLTPPDGTSGRMQMFRFVGPDPDRSSGLDQEILIHELTHGTSNRLHNNANGLNATMSGGMGEGWSDFYAMSLLYNPADGSTGIYGMGGYSTLNIIAGFDANYYYGIRRFPHARISVVGANGKPHNPLTFADIDAAQIDLTDGAFPRGPIGSGTAFQVHNIGEVWCAILVEARAQLMDLYGPAAGNARMLQLVTDGMKLNPANPTFIDSRNSILAASLASGGSEDEQKALWRGFALRGLGFFASAVSSSSQTVVEDFHTPNLRLGDVELTDEDCVIENNAADPGETIQLAIEVENLVGIAATDTTVSINDGPATDYGTVAAGESATRSLSFTVPEDVECGQILLLTININSSFGPTSYTYELQIGEPTGQGPASTYSTGDLAVPIADVATTEIPIQVDGTGLVGDVNVSVRLNHTFDADLQIAIVAPDGTAVPLANNRGGSGDNYGTGTNDCSGTPTVFDDSAAAAISSGSAPFAGSFRPESPLLGLRGRPINGEWKLRITDTASLDVGVVGCVKLEIRPQFFFCCGVEGTPFINAVPPAILEAEGNTPANGAPDPGEIVTMNFPLANVGSGSTTNLVAELLPGGGVISPSGHQNYGALVPGGDAVARPFTFEVDRSVPCGGDITATFHVSDGSLDLGTVEFVIRAGSQVVGGTSGSNPDAIAIPGTGTGASTGAPASLYPSTVDVSGVSGTVSKVTVTVHGFSHTFPADVDMLLVGPGGQTVMLMSDVGGGNDAVDATITFADDGAAIPATIVSGTYVPTNSGATDPFPAPAPAGPYGTALSTFNGLDPNGTWSLFIVDDASLDTGSISGGWSLSITTNDPYCVIAPAITDLSVSSPVLWPPNHKMVNERVNWSVFDEDGVAEAKVLSVTSNEPVSSPDPEDLAPDWEIVNPFQPNALVRLRAERLDTGNGRVYTITVYAADTNGHATTRSTTVRVPFAQTKK